MTPMQDSTTTREEVRQKADDAKAAVAAKGKRIARQQKDSAADELEVVGEALCRTADQMRDNQDAFVSHLAGSAGQQLRELGQQLRQKDVGTLMRDAGDYARRSPGAFIAGTVVAGFLLARFMKSSERHPHENESRHKGRKERDMQAWRGNETPPASTIAQEPPVLTDSPSIQGDRYAH